MKLPSPGEFVRHHGTLIRTEDYTPPPQATVREFIFEVQEAQCELRLNGEQLKELQTLNDFHGLGSAVKAAIEDMKRYSSENNIGKDSDLEVVVIKVVSQFRSRAINRENFYDKQYCDFDGTYSSGKPLPEPVKTIVWSSKGF